MATNNNTNSTTIIINLLPNVYWLYNINDNTNNTTIQQNFKIEIKKNTELLGIHTVLDLDDKLAFWGKSKEYTNEIRNELEKDEFSKLLFLLKKINELIKNAYIKNQPIMITTFKSAYLDIGVVVWIYYFHINANIPFDTVIKLLSLKIIGNIVLSDTIKKFLSFINLNKI